MSQLITKDIFTIVTHLITQKLEQGIVPWRRPWKEADTPKNFVTQRPYRGMNFLLLNSLGFACNEFLTWNQIHDLGGRVKKGEKANLVVLWVWIDEDVGKQSHAVIGRKRPVLRYYHVFNIEQCAGIPSRAETLPDAKRHNPIERCETIVAEMPNRPKIVHNENDAYYHRFGDFINMPKIELFETSESYYGTLFHELMHSTGYVDRLNRKEITEENTFGSESYSIEELTAEIGTCYLASYSGIAQKEMENNVAYIQGWLKRLNQDKRFIVYASAHAQKAVDYILNIKHEENIVIDHLENAHV
jgi:antirestriction protein ArdC